LIGLIDPTHVSHDAVHAWFAAEGAPSWATCPITENGVLRIVGHPAYPNTPGSPCAVADTLRKLCALPGHVFWPDGISLLDRPRADANRLLTHKQVTDSYLLAMAAARGGKLATLDRRLSTAAVEGGPSALHII
jgi:predicted nucleic acid-binding protein